MSSPVLHQFAYVSHQATDFTDDSIRELMVKARKKNKTLELTGLLLFDKPLFLQILEGPRESIEQIIKDIREDERHKDMDIIHFNHQLIEREFSMWRMACKILGDGRFEDYKELDGRVKALLNTANPNGDIAHQLLLDFRCIQNNFHDI